MSISIIEVRSVIEGVISASRSREPVVESNSRSRAQWKEGRSEPVMRAGIGVGA